MGQSIALEFGSAARLSKRSGSVWNCLWGHALKISHGINRKSRVLYPVLDFYQMRHGLRCRKSTNQLINQSYITLYVKDYKTTVMIGVNSDSLSLNCMSFINWYLNTAAISDLGQCTMQNKARCFKNLLKGLNYSEKKAVEICVYMFWYELSK